MKILRDLDSIATPIQLLALLPFFDRRPELFTRSTFGKLYAHGIALAALISSSFFCYDVLTFSREYKLTAHSQGDTEEINRTIETLFCVCSYTIMVVSSVQNSGKHYRTLRDIANIDEYLEAHGFKARYSCRYLGILLGLVSASVVVVAFYYIRFLSEIGPQRQIALLLVYSLQMSYSCLLALYLRTILKNLTQRIEFLNGRLDAFTRYEKSTPDKDNWRELSNLIETFCKFRFIAENLNSVMGLSFLFYMGFAFYTVTNQSYLAFSILTTPAHLRKGYGTIGMSCAWVLAEAAIMAVICNSCDCLASEVSSRILR